MCKMDKFDGDSIENPKHFYKMHDGTAYTINVVTLNNSSNNNNNNNDKMDDANKTTSTLSDTNIKLINNSSIQLRNETLNNSDIAQMPNELNEHELCVPQHENEQLVDASYLQCYDNQSNASDLSDNNSTDNISFISDESDQRLNFSDQRLNHLTDDDSNSDDIVYAYRGADFGEPVEVNADDETDYLEMDFEPDPASEIEQETNRPSHIGSPILFDSSPNTINDGPLESLNRSSGGGGSSGCGEWLITRNGIDIDAIKCENGIQTIFNNKKSPNSNIDCEFRLDNNKQLDLDWQSNKQKYCKSLDADNKLDVTTNVDDDDDSDDDDDGQRAYYDNTVSLSTTKYTGTIPKTSRPMSRPIKMKLSSTLVNGNVSASFKHDSQPSCSYHNERNGTVSNSWSSNNHKRWKITDDSQPSTSSCSSSSNAVASTSSFQSEKQFKMPSTSTSTAQSRSFPCGNLTNQRTNSKALNDKLMANSLNGQRTLTLSNNEIVYGAFDNGTIISHDDNDSNSVTFSSSYCSSDTIINALKSINVLPNLTILKEALNVDESEVPSMNIPEYLVHVSKRNCNYIAIISAIERSCSNVQVQFFQATDEFSDMVNIPVQAILSRLPDNGSLKNVLAIENSRFHRMNVLGKLVGMIRRFTDMRNDVNHNEYISIPQFYRTGFICVTKIEPKSKLK